MKSLLLFCLLSLGLNVSADVGDKYSTYGKLGRVSKQSSLLEIVGFTVSVDHDANPATANVNVKPGIHMDVDAAANPITDTMDLYAQTLREFPRMTVGVVYDPADISKTDKCLGNDMRYVDPENLFGGGRTCYQLIIKDIVFK